ncbi:DegQ family serine endoprotease [Beijerinckia indica]|uniref:Protease Do n=1 Tax=Beijerinckia indica subsp. indica (strain ATCC 9039 / DSM 1715 / NCIMB 8712) TaxID=395963 RepID=B2IF98_BEII9|nr:protease Do [Beijerinckia indica subsp. indica ATCC 9039]
MTSCGRSPFSPLRLLVALGLATGLLCDFGPSASAETREIPVSHDDVLLSFAGPVKKAQPAVVNVYASRTERQPRNVLLDDPVFRRFFGDGNGRRPGGPTAQSLGSGVLVDPSGLVVTNFHVIEGMTDVKVALTDKREFEATIVLRDQRTDLAVLRLKGGDGAFPSMEVGDSDTLQVGDLVLAIGNPFGVGQTVTQGIVSALARTQVGISDYGFFIQTDAAINPGNSGGALIDMKARLVGINSAIFSQTGSSIGIGFAIPVNMVKVVVAAAKSGGHQVHRPWLGASLQGVSREIADSLGLDRPSGALIVEVASQSPAAEAGLKRGDLITRIDGQTLEDPESFGYRLATRPLGGKAQLTVLRNGKPIDATLNLSAAPEQPPRDPVKLNGHSPLTGLSVVNLSPAVTEEFSIQGAFEGVVINDIDENSPAANVNFQRGDVIIAVNGAKITSTHQLEKAMSEQHYYWKVTVGRGHDILTTVLGG